VAYTLSDYMKIIDYITDCIKIIDMKIIDPEGRYALLWLKGER